MIFNWLFFIIYLYVEFFFLCFFFKIDYIVFVGIKEFVVFLLKWFLISRDNEESFWRYILNVF